MSLVASFATGKMAFSFWCGFFFFFFCFYVTSTLVLYLVCDLHLLVTQWQFIACLNPALGRRVQLHRCHSLGQVSAASGRGCCLLLWGLFMSSKAFGIRQVPSARQTAEDVVPVELRSDNCVKIFLQFPQKLDGKWLPDVAKVPPTLR